MLGLLGVVQLGLAYQLYSRAIRHVPALQVVLVTVLEPILNPTWVLLATGERPGPRALVGGAIVLGASTFRSITSLNGRTTTLPVVAAE
jgi:drug/metabolite transporter (DMT)-like permease